MKKDRFPTLRRLYPFAKPFIGLNIVSISCQQVSNLLSLMIPYLIKVLIDDILPSGDIKRLSVFGLTLIGVVIGSICMGFLGNTFYALHSERMIIFARDKLFSELLNYKMDFHDHTEMGEMISRLKDDTRYIHTLISYLVNLVLTNGLKIIIVLFILWKMNKQLTLILIATLPIYLFIIKYFGDKVERQINIYRNYLAKLLTFLHDVLGKIQLIKNYNYESEVRQSHQKLSDTIKHHSVKTEIFGYFTHSLTSIVTLLTSVAVLWVGGSLMIRSNALTLGELVAFYNYLNHIFAPTRELANSTIVFRQAKNSLERFLAFIDLRDQYNEVLEESQTDVQELDNFQGEILFKDVTFCYDPEKPLFKNMSFKIKPREKVVIYGSSGIGKSSLVKMLKKFYLPSSGSIYIDGVSMNNISLKFIRKHIGYIAQEPKLINDTIEMNLRIGKKDATEQEMWEVLKAVNLVDFVQSLDGQLSANLVNGGATISGGQKQRLAIARLMLQNPKVVLLDEYLSNIDPVSQKIIENSMRVWLQDRTVIFISHEQIDSSFADKQFYLDSERNLQEFNVDEASKYWKGIS